jgi:hypothetical protein
MAARVQNSPMRTIWLVVNLVVGPLVLVSYLGSAMVWDAETVGGLWGAVPEAARPLYTANMFLAAAGFFAFGNYLLRRIDAQRVEVFGRFGFGVFTLAYGVVLGGSCLWMPLTCAAIAGARDALVPVIFGVLAAVAGGSLLLLAALVSARPCAAPRARAVAIVGACFFCLQTVVLDGIVWPLHFSI